MTTFALICLAIVALLHLIFALAEMVFWPSVGPRLLGTDDQKIIRYTKPMAFNQGLYNLFLVAGLVGALILQNEALAILFLLFVIVAGIVGALTVTFRIFVVQGIPGIVALLAVMA